jgi:gliding motility-associated-like protein
VVGNAIWNTISGSGTVSNPALPNSAVTGLSIGSNQFVWTISNGICPPSVDTVEVVIDEMPTLANAGTEDSTCTADYQLNANQILIGSGFWTSGTGGVTVPDTFNNLALANGLAIGSNAVIWNSVNGLCASSDTVLINRLIPPTANAGLDDEVCGLDYEMKAIPSVFSTFWSDTSAAVYGNLNDPLSIVTVNAEGSHAFIWTVDNGVCPASDTVVISYYQAPLPANAGADQEISFGTAATMAAIPAVFGQGNWTVVDGNGDFGNANDPQSLVDLLEFGLNTFLWTVTNGVCPATSDEVIILATELLIPTGFSPNGDGKNDLFVIQGLESLPSTGIQVFNRWGNLIYENADYQNNWAGTDSKGAELVDDTYYIVVKLPDSDYTGYLVIKR